MARTCTDCNELISSAVIGQCEKLDCPNKKNEEKGRVHWENPPAEKVDQGALELLLEKKPKFDPISGQGDLFAE